MAKKKINKYIVDFLEAEDFRDMLASSGLKFAEEFLLSVREFYIENDKFITEKQEKSLWKIIKLKQRKEIN